MRLACNHIRPRYSGAHDLISMDFRPAINSSAQGCRTLIAGWWPAVSEDIEVSKEGIKELLCKLAQQAFKGREVSPAVINKLKCFGWETDA